MLEFSHDLCLSYELELNKWGFYSEDENQVITFIIKIVCGDGISNYFSLDRYWLYSPFLNCLMPRLPEV